MKENRLKKYLHIASFDILFLDIFETVVHQPYSLILTQEVASFLIHVET